MNKKIIVIVSIILVAIISCGIVLLKVNNSNEEKIQNIRINSKEGQECIAQLKEYIQNHNENYEHIEILKIEKHEYDIIGDGYAMGMNEKPVVIGHNIFYYIIVKKNNNDYIYRYSPMSDYKIEDVSYQFN